MAVEMAAATRAPVLLAAVRLEATDPSGWIPRPRNPIPKPLFSVSKPSWIVRTESNVWKERKKKPDSPCDGCSGSRRVECRDCCGRGAGPDCFGAGDNRYVLAFPFINRESKGTRDPKKYKVDDKSGPQSAADYLRNGQEPTSNQRGRSLH